MKKMKENNGMMRKVKKMESFRKVFNYDENDGSEILRNLYFEMFRDAYYRNYRFLFLF